MNQLITKPPVENLPDLYCGHCSRRLMHSDNFCSECGTGCRDLIEFVDPGSGRSLQPVGNSSSPLVSAGGGMETINAFLNNRLAVIGIIALIGPLGLPALWFSWRFSKSTKIITTTAYFLVTIVLPIALAWYWLDYSVRPLIEVFDK